MPRLFERTRGGVLNAHILLEAIHRCQLRRRRPMTFEPGAHRRVRQLGAIAHGREIHVGALDATVTVHRHVDDHRGTVFAFIERRQIGG